MPAYTVRIHRSEDNGAYFAFLCKMQPALKETLYWSLPGGRYARVLTGPFTPVRYWFLPMEKRIEKATRELMTLVPELYIDDTCVETLNAFAASVARQFRGTAP